jgi:hypothetical protein
MNGASAAWKERMERGMRRGRARHSARWKGLPVKCQGDSVKDEQVTNFFFSMWE